MSFPCFAKLLRKAIDEHRWPWRLGYFQLGGGGLAVLNSVVKKLSLLILIISSEIHYSMFHCMSTAA